MPAKQPAKKEHHLIETARTADLGRFDSSYLTYQAIGSISWSAEQIGNPAQHLREIRKTLAALDQANAVLSARILATRTVFPAPRSAAAAA